VKQQKIERCIFEQKIKALTETPRRRDQKVKKSQSELDRHQFFTPIYGGHKTHHAPPPTDLVLVTDSPSQCRTQQRITLCFGVPL